MSANTKEMGGQQKGERTTCPPKRHMKRVGMKAHMCALLLYSIAMAAWRSTFGPDSTSSPANPPILETAHLLSSSIVLPSSAHLISEGPW